MAKYLSTANPSAEGPRVYINEKVTEPGTAALSTYVTFQPFTPDCVANVRSHTLLRGYSTFKIKAFFLSLHFAKVHSN